MTTIAGCILRNDEGAYLLVQERQEKVRGKWGIPAGYAEAGESEAETAIRETHEEVGFNVSVEAAPLYVYKNPEKQKVYVAFIGTITGGELQVQESEILNAEWLSFEAIVGLRQEGMIRDEWIFEALRKARDENTRH